MSVSVYTTDVSHLETISGSLTSQSLYSLSLSLNSTWAWLSSESESSAISDKRWVLFVHSLQRHNSLHLSDAFRQEHRALEQPFLHEQLTKHKMLSGAIGKVIHNIERFSLSKTQPWSTTCGGCIAAAAFRVTSTFSRIGTGSEISLFWIMMPFETWVVPLPESVSSEKSLLSQTTLWLECFCSLE